MSAIMNKIVPAVKIVLACLIMGGLSLFRIKWNPWIAGKKDADD
jgi:hypothetical protein